MDNFIAILRDSNSPEELEELKVKLFRENVRVKTDKSDIEDMKIRIDQEKNELEEEKSYLYQNGDILRAAYDKSIEADRMKTTFLHYMTNQMTGPAESIDKSVTTLCNNFHEISKQEADSQVGNIQWKGQMIAELLNHMAHFTETEKGKEADHE